MTKCNCQFCILCECGHKADEHIAGIGQCFLCDCPSHSDESWKDKEEPQENEIQSMFDEFSSPNLSIARNIVRGKGGN